MMSDKVYLVTGASSGMGRDTVYLLAEKGVKAVTLLARRKEVLDEIIADLAKKHPNVKTLAVAGDVTSDNDNQRAVQETVKAFGGIHGAFVNAGTYRGGTPIEQLSDEDMNAVLDTNVKSVLYGFRHLIPAIKATVGEEGPTGSIVVNSSCMGVTAIGPKSAGSAVYSASKAFVNSLVESAAIENAPRIRVNAVLPGVVRTNIMPVDDDTYQAFGAALQPLWGRPGTPREVSTLVAFLLSDEASFISGDLIKADGLWSLSGGSL